MSVITDQAAQYMRGFDADCLIAGVVNPSQPGEPSSIDVVKWEVNSKIAKIAAGGMRAGAFTVWADGRWSIDVTIEGYFAANLNLFSILRLGVNARALTLKLTKNPAAPLLRWYLPQFFLEEMPIAAEVNDQLISLKMTIASHGEFYAPGFVAP